MNKSRNGSSVETFGEGIENSAVRVKAAFTLDLKFFLECLKQKKSFKENEKNLPNCTWLCIPKSEDETSDGRVEYTCSAQTSKKCFPFSLP